MAMKTTFLAVVLLFIAVSKPTSAVDCTTGGNEACGPTEKCESNTCVERGTCDVSSDCSDHGTCETDESCKCDPQYAGKDCSKECDPACVNGKCQFDGTNLVCDCTGTGYEGDSCNEVTCGNKKCTLPQVCAGPSGSEDCVADPCTGTPCGANGECSYDDKEADPKPVCTCKNGYGGDKCTDSGGNIVAAAPGILLAVILAAFYL